MSAKLEQQAEAEAEAEYLTKQLENARQRAASLTDQAQRVANTVKAVMKELDGVNLVNWKKGSSSYVRLAEKQVAESIAAALPHLVAAMGAAAVVLDDRLDWEDRLKEMTWEQWAENHEG